MAAVVSDGFMQNLFGLNISWLELSGAFALALGLVAYGVWVVRYSLLSVQRQEVVVVPSATNVRPARPVPITAAKVDAHRLPT